MYYDGKFKDDKKMVKVHETFQKKHVILDHKNSKHINKFLSAFFLNNITLIIHEYFFDSGIYRFLCNEIHFPFNIFQFQKYIFFYAHNEFIPTDMILDN